MAVRWWWRWTDRAGRPKRGADVRGHLLGNVSKTAPGPVRHFPPAPVAGASALYLGRPRGDGTSPAWHWREALTRS
ncbi:hypothetical protein FRAHR75_80088 [Frankia sp. Hr75.2]|nr:hypothetical protein FRAHR75_80088 [Frankia sp. Hr75.2]